GYAKERHENGAVAAKVHVGQVIHRCTLAQLPDETADAFLTRDLGNLVEATASLDHDGIHLWIGCGRVHGGRFDQIHGQDSGGCIQPDKMRSEHQGGPGSVDAVLDVFVTTQVHHAADFIFRAVPQDGAIN